MTGLHKVPLQVTRGAVFESAAEQILAADHASVFRGLNILYRDAETGELEPGVDAGGLTREFFSAIISEVTTWAELESPPGPAGPAAGPFLRRQNSARGRGQPLFKALPDNSLMLARSGRPPMYYIALGKVFAMVVLYALKDESITLPVSLSSCLLKFMVGRPIVAGDVRALDPIFFKNRMESFLMEGGVSFMKEILGEERLYFVACPEDFGQSREGASFEVGGGDPNEPTELLPGGAQREVTEANKHEYVALLSEFYVCGGVRQQLGAFLRGFHELVPVHLLGALATSLDPGHAGAVDHQAQEAALLGGFGSKDLGLLLTGVPEVDVSDWRGHSSVDPPENSIAQRVAELWWSFLGDLGDEEKAKVLQFCTGLSHLPAGGFSRLYPPFKLVVKLHASRAQLPTAHTCFNTVELAPYASRAELSEKVMLAVTEGASSFGFR